MVNPGGTNVKFGHSSALSVTNNGRPTLVLCAVWDSGMAFFVTSLIGQGQTTTYEKEIQLEKLPMAI
jgi:hypothetical protein